MRTILRVIDLISEYTGKVVRWAVVALVVSLCCEVTLRYVFGAPTAWSYPVSCMLGGSIVALGWSYVHRHQGHVRVDILYMRLPPRGKAIVDVVGTLLLLVPLLIALMYASVSWMWTSWLTGEKMVVSSWLPLLGPIRTVVAIGFCLFLIQGVANCTRDLYFLIRNKPYD